MLSKPVKSTTMNSSMRILFSVIFSTVLIVHAAA